MKKMSRKKKIFLIVTFLYLVVYAVWRIFFTMPVEYGFWSMLLAVTLLLCELAGIIESLNNIRGVLRDFNPDRPVISPDMYPDVDVFIATHDEPENILYKTINGCLRMDYPDKSKVHIYICDDGARLEIENLAKKMNVGYFPLSGNTEAKAGNLNNAIFQTNSPLVVTFDADMIPMSHFLMNNVPYFYLPQLEKKDGVWVKRERELDEKIGFIQTPQSFYNTDLFQYNMFLENKMPNEQDYFFRKVNIGRNRSNSPIYAGSNTIISREALEKIGGIVTGCITEDMATGIEIQKAGYRCYSVDEVGANGMAPIDVESLIKQRARWGRGCVQIMKKLKFFLGKGGEGLSLSAKGSYLSSYLYWFSYLAKFMFVVIPPIATLANLTIMRCALWQVLLIYIPMYLLNVRSVYLVSGGSRDDKWNNITMMVLCPYLIFPILKECIGIREKKFWVTNKNVENVETKNTKLMIPHACLLILCAAGTVCAIHKIMHGEFIKYALIVFWTIRSCYDLALSIMFMMGRRNYRKTERLNINEKVIIESDEIQLELTTNDASETGFSINSELPYFIKPETDVDVIIANDRYESKMKAKVLNVDKYGSCWKYGFEITEISDEDKSEYHQILFDRIPPLPQKIEKHMSYTDDMIVNIKGRTKELSHFKREYPRCIIDQHVEIEGKEIYIKNFNYEFILVKMAGAPLKNLNLLIKNEFVIEAVYTEEFQNKTGSFYLYKICNQESLIQNKRVPEILKEFENEYCEKLRLEKLEEKKNKKIRKDELNDIVLIIEKAACVLLFCFLILAGENVYAAQELSVAGTYNWNDTMEVTVEEAEQKYQVHVNNESAKEAGYGQAGFIFQNGFENDVKEVSFELENGKMDTYIAVGFLDSSQQVTWMKDGNYLGFVSDEGKEILCSDSDMYRIKAGEKGTVYVNLSLYENLWNTQIGLVLGLVSGTEAQCDLYVSDFKAFTEDSRLPVLEQIGIVGKDEIMLQTLGERIYNYSAPQGFQFVAEEFSDGIALDDSGTLHIQEGASPRELEIVSVCNDWMIKKQVTVTENPYGIELPKTVSPEYKENQDAVRTFVPLIRGIGIIVVGILAVCYIVPRERSKRRNM